MGLAIAHGTRSVMVGTLGGIFSGLESITSTLGNGLATAVSKMD
jgi:vacuolar protein sorting-associated protein 13A/C